MADPYYDNTVLMLPFDGNGPEAGNAFDRSKYRHGMQLYGGVSFSTGKYGSGINFNNAATYTQGNYLGSSASLLPLVALTGDFTVELWGFFYSYGASWGSYLMDTRNGSATPSSGWLLNVGDSANSNKLTFVYSTNVLFSNAAPPLNQWVHLAVSRQGSTIRMFIDGVLQTSTLTLSGTIPAAMFNIGTSNNNASTTGISGLLDDIRITNGTARYTANFTPPGALKGDYPISDQWRSGVIGGISRKDTFNWIDLPSTHKAIGTPITYQKNTQRLNTHWGGTGTLTGTVKIGAVPAQRKVRLYESGTGILIQEKLSGTDGNYQFEGLTTRLKYDVVAVDYAEQYNHVIAARVTPV